MKDNQTSNLFQKVMQSEKKLNDLSIDELNSLLFELIYEDKKNIDTDIVHNLLEKLYPKEYGKLYLKILRAKNDKDKKELIQEYANSEYPNEMFCQKGFKTFWLIEAEILYARGYPKIKDVLEYLFEWLQDLNWPGSDIIFRLLNSIPKDIFLERVKKALRIAIYNNDLEWISSLKSIIEERNITNDEFQDQELYEFIKKNV